MKNKFTLTHFILIVVVLLFLDQWLKFYIKTHFILGEEKDIIGKWFRIHFVENSGMAFGWTLWGESQTAKILLSTMRLLIISLGITYFIYKIKKAAHVWTLIAWTLVIAGALGNLIDSLFYGVLFDESGNIFNPHISTFLPEQGGYAGMFKGKVVDMFYFPLIQTTIPHWFPFWAGENFEFFRPVFNLADSYITVGITFVFIYYNWLQRKEKQQTSLHSEIVS